MSWPYREDTLRLAIVQLSRRPQFTLLAIGRALVLLAIGEALVLLAIGTLVLLAIGTLVLMLAMPPSVRVLREREAVSPGTK